MDEQVAGSNHPPTNPVEELSRKRAWKPKVKTGCITCRLRRVKCDEVKPFCNRCTKAKRTCGGYTQGPATRTPPDQWLLELRNPSDILPMGTEKERETLYFFYRETTSDLAGFFESSFWQQDLPQATWHHQPLRHAVIALAVLHREFMTRGGSALPSNIKGKDISFALEHYNHAIREITNAQTVDIIMTLTFCILSHCFAWFQGYLASALGHLRGGLKILREIDAGRIVIKQDGRYPISLDSLRSLLIGLDLQVRGMMVRDQLQFWEPKPKSVQRELALQYVDFDTAKSFVEEAFDEVYGFFTLMDSGSGVEPDVSPEQAARITDQYQKAVKLFDGTLSQAWASLSEQQRKSLLVLDIYRHQVDIFIEFYGSDKKPSEMNWDVSEDSFRKMLHYATQALEGESTPTSDSNSTLSPDSITEYTLDEPRPIVAQAPTIAKLKASAAKGYQQERPVLTFGMGLISSLWMVVFRCRDPEIRRAVIRLLRRHPRREGFWDGTMLAGIAQRLVDLEEGACLRDGSITDYDPDWRVLQASDIPERHRIVRVIIHYTGPRSVIVKYATTSDRQRGEGGAMYALAW